MKKDVALKEIENIKNQLVKKYKPEKIILFGSAAWGVKVDGRPGTLDCRLGTNEILVVSC